MRAAHAARSASIDSAITDARINMNTALGDNASTSEALAAMSSIEKLNALLADVNLLSGNMSAAPLAASSDHDREIQGRAEGHPQADRR